MAAGFTGIRPYRLTMLATATDTHDDAFSVVFGPGRTSGLPDVERDAIGTQRQRNLQLAYDLWGRDHEHLFTVAPEHQFLTALCAIDYTGGAFASIDGSYRTHSAMTAAMLTRLTDAEDRKPLPSFYIDLDSPDAELMLVPRWSEVLPLPSRLKLADMPSPLAIYDAWARERNG